MGDNSSHLAGGYLRYGAPPFHPSAAPAAAFPANDDSYYFDQAEPLAAGDFRGCFFSYATAAAAPNDDVGYTCSAAGCSYTDDVGYTCSGGFFHEFYASVEEGHVVGVEAFSDSTEQPLGGGDGLVHDYSSFGHNIHAFVGFNSAYTDTDGYYAASVGHIVGVEALAPFPDAAGQLLGGVDRFFGENFRAFGPDGFYYTDGCYYASAANVGVEAHAAFSSHPPAGQLVVGADGLFHDGFLGDNMCAFGWNGYDAVGYSYAHNVDPAGVQELAASSDPAAQPHDGGVGCFHDWFSVENVRASASDGYSDTGRGHNGEPSCVVTLSASSDAAGHTPNVEPVGVQTSSDAAVQPLGGLIHGRPSCSSWSGDPFELIPSSTHSSSYTDTDGYYAAIVGHIVGVEALAPFPDAAGQLLGGVDRIFGENFRAFGPDAFYYTDGCYASAANVGVQTSSDAAEQPLGGRDGFVHDYSSFGHNIHAFVGFDSAYTDTDGYYAASVGHIVGVEALAPFPDAAGQLLSGVDRFFGENFRAFRPDAFYYTDGCYYASAANVGVQTSSDAAVQPLGGLFHGRPSCSSWSGDPFELISETAVQSVWRDNYAEVFEHVVAKLRQPRRRLYVALDLEFVADASTEVHLRPFSWNEWYDQLHTFVNGGDVVQVGVALAFELVRHGGEIQAPSPVIALEINLKFDVAARQYNRKSVDFLKKQGHCLAEHKDRGVTAEQFIDGFLRHLPFGDDSVTWVTYHGDRDFGFLVRLLQPGGRGALPPERAAFMRQVRKAFPIFYDVRVLGQVVKDGFSGKLTALAERLSVQRIGVEHNAGSDALLTMSCYSEILRRSQHELHRLHSRRGLLSGMEEYDMAIKCARHIGDASFTTVKVRGHNFDEEARRIVELVTSNFMIVGVEVLLPQFRPFRSAADEQRDYDLMKSRLESISEFQVEIGFMNAEGMLAFGRVWKFYLRCSNVRRSNLAGGGNRCVDPRRLAWLLASCGATHNPDVVWAMCQGLEGIACLIMSSLPAGGGGLPDDWCSYVEHRRGRFPRMYDVGLIAQRWPDIGDGLYDIARNLEVIQDQDTQPVEKVLLVLRCYKRLEESPHFPLIASARLSRVR